MNLKILSQQVLENVPSASGIVKLDDRLFVIGDNSPWLFELGMDYSIISKTLIVDSSLAQNDEIDKPVKPDLEALELIDVTGNPELILFGSGSKSPQRDNFVRVSLKDDYQVEKHELIDFYAALRTQEILTSSELNIEATAVLGDRLFLLNRRKNVIFEYSYRDFFTYLDKKSKLPEPKTYEVKLPKHEGVDAGLSGATIIPGQNKMIITASLENTSNAYDDGAVLGSYIGIIDLSQLSDVVTPYCQIIENADGPLKIKVESVTVINSEKNNIRLLLVTDSDGGDSEVLEVSLGF